MTVRPGRRARVLAAAAAAGLAIVLAGSAIAGPLPASRGEPAAPAALPPGSVETPGRNELVSTPQRDFGALSATTGSTIDEVHAPPTISANGRYVVFVQTPNEGGNQVAVRDRRSDTTTVIDGPDDNGPLRHPTISGDGRWIAYTRSIDGPNPTEVVLVEREREREVALPRLPGRYFFPDQPALSFDGQVLAVRARGTETTEILVLDRATGEWQVVSVDVNGDPIGSRLGDAAQPAISGDGRIVAFTAGSARIQFVEGVKPTDTRQVYVRDRRAGRTVLASVAQNGQAADGTSLTPAISRDGGLVAFASGASDLVPGGEQAEAQVYAWSAVTRQVELVSRSTDGQPGNDTSAFPAVTADGASVAFSSLATNLVPGDTTSGVTSLGSTSAALAVRSSIVVAGDIFVRSRATARTSRISVARGNEVEANGHSFFPSISGTGRYVAFTSLATNLITNDRNETTPDVFVRERPPRVTAAPNPLDFGSTLLGSLGVTREATIRSTGVTPARIGEITIGGRDGADFVVSSNPCTGQTLAPGATCAVQVLFIGLANGDRVGTLRIASDAGDPLALRLTGTVGRPRLQVEPELGPPGTVVIATGSGFPAFAPVTLSWSVGITADPLVPVVADENGSFVTQVLVLPRDREGDRRLRATVSVPGLALDPVTDRFLVTRPTVVPPTSGLIQVFAAAPGEPIILRR